MGDMAISKRDMDDRRLRRQLLPRNPLFAEALTQARARLGIPALGFSEAVAQLTEHVPAAPEGYPLGRPDLPALVGRASSLGLPLDERVEEWHAEYARRGLDFDAEVERIGWGALPLFSRFEWASWWSDREWRQAGLTAPPSGTLDPHVPSNRAALGLAASFQLGEDYASTVLSLLLGVPPGGGDADLIIDHRADGAGLSITIPSLPYDTTLKAWSDLYREAIQPTLLYAAGKVRSGIPGRDALEEARRKAKPGRPRGDAEKLEWDLRLWEFCYREGFLDNIGIDAFKAFLDSIPDGDPEKAGFETLDENTFRRSVKEIDRLLRPTGSGADLLW